MFFSCTTPNHPCFPTSFGSSYRLLEFSFRKSSLCKYIALRKTTIAKNSLKDLNKAHDCTWKQYENVPEKKLMEQVTNDTRKHTAK